MGKLEKDKDGNPVIVVPFHIRHLGHCKGNCRGITLLAELCDNREAERREMKSLVFHHLHPADMAIPFCHQVRHGDGSDSNTPNILLRQTGVAVHW